MSTYIVFGKTRREAYDKLENMTKNFLYGDVSEFIRNGYQCRTEMKNGDVYRALEANKFSTIGTRCHGACVQYSIDLKTYREIVLPCLVLTDSGEEPFVEFWE